MKVWQANVRPGSVERRYVLEEERQTFMALLDFRLLKFSVEEGSGSASFAFCVLCNCQLQHKPRIDYCFFLAGVSYFC